MPAIPREEYPDRCRRAAASAASLGFDGLVVWSMGGSTLDSFGDVAYLTNHYPVEPKAPDLRPHWTGFGHAALVMRVDGRSVLLVGPPNWRADLVVADEVRVDRDLYAAVTRCLRDLGLTDGRVGLVRERLVPLPLVRELGEALPHVELVAADAVLEGLRIRKSLSEIAMMRHASAVAVEIMNAMLGEVSEGRTDGDLAATGFAEACRHGATPYDFAFASGPFSQHAYWPRMPGYDCFRPYERGDVVHPDIFGCLDGYFYDFQRSTVVGGEPTPSQRDALEGAVELVHHICDALRPGQRACDAHAAGVVWLRRHGLAASSERSGHTDLDTWPAFGHGLGLGWESPWLTALDETVLEPGMTICVESAVALGGATAIHEETVLVTDGEPELLTAGCPARWWN